MFSLITKPQAFLSCLQGPTRGSRSQSDKLSPETVTLWTIMVHLYPVVDKERTN